MTPSKEPDMQSGSPKKGPVSGGVQVSLPQPVWLQQLLGPPGGPMELPSRFGGHIMSRGDQHTTGGSAEGGRQTCTGTQHPEFPGALPLLHPAAVLVQECKGKTQRSPLTPVTSPEKKRTTDFKPSCWVLFSFGEDSEMLSHAQPRPACPASIGSPYPPDPWLFVATGMPLCLSNAPRESWPLWGLLTFMLPID